MKRAIRLATLTIALSENPVCDVTLLVIEQINAKRGVSGRSIRPVVVDGNEALRNASFLWWRDRWANPGGSALISSAPQRVFRENTPLHNPDRLLPGHLPGTVSPRCRVELLSGTEPPEPRNHQSTPVHCRQQGTGTGILRPGEKETCHCPRILADPHGDDGNGSNKSSRTKAWMLPNMRRSTGESDPFWPFGKRNWNSTTCSFSRLDGQVIFSLAREDDLGTNLRSGPYKDSPLAQAFDNASLLLTAEISDFDFYPPSNKVAAFIAAPLEKEGTIIGVLAAQLDIDRISAIAGDYDGLGQTGEIVVGRKIGEEAVFLTPTRHDPRQHSSGDTAWQKPPVNRWRVPYKGSTGRVPPRITLAMTCGPSGDTCPDLTGAWWSRWTWTKPSPPWRR